MGSSTTDSDTMSLHAPKHPVPQLQGPFEESMAESINETIDRAKPDPMTRRTMLLDGPTYERVCAGRWKQKPGEKFHPLWKISAQMSFGIHLLAEGLAKSEEDVMAILQTHVDDVDGFLESTSEDFDLAQSDVAERLRYLKLPLEHVEVFDRMLEDRTFRVSIVEGNEKIEHIMERTSEATKDALKDVQKGLQATHALGNYLDKVNLSWTSRSPEHDAVFVAMVGNVEGWHRAFEDLHHQGTRLGVSLVQLASIVSEMQRRAGVASRKTLLKRHELDYVAMRSQESPPRQRGDRYNSATNSSNADIQSPQVPSKPLPQAPSAHTIPKQMNRGTSFQDSQSGQTSSTVPEDKSVSDRVERGGQAAQRPALGDKTKRLKNQKSAPDLKRKPDITNTPDLTGASELGSLGLGAGLGIGRMKETNTSRPVIIQREPTEAGHGSSGTQLHSKLAREHSARILNAPVQDQAPPPRKRLSFSLRSKNKDRLTEGQPHPASTKASDKLRKSVLSPRGEVSPGSAGGPSPALPSSRGSPENNDVNTSLNSSPRVVSPSPGQMTSPPAATVKSPRKYNVTNPTFTSHPPNMEMAISPSLKQIQTPEFSAPSLEVPGLRAVPDLDSGNTSYESSLGEPGPEVSAIDEGDDAVEEPPIAELDSGTPVAQGPVELEATVPNPSQPVAFELEAPQHSGPVASNTGATMSTLPPTVGATIQSHSDFFKLSPQQAGEKVDEGGDLGRESTQMSPPLVAKDRSQTALLHRSFLLPPGGQSKVLSLLPLDTEEPNTAVRHRSFQLPPENKSYPTGVTSEVNGDSQSPMHPTSFELPADTDAGTSHLNRVTDESRKAMQHRSFRLPSESQAGDTAAMTSEENQMPSALHRRSFQLPQSSNQLADVAKVDKEERKEKSDSTRNDMQTLPSRISTSEMRMNFKRQSPKHPLNLIDIISHTPPGSPIHERPSSSASFHSAANSARLTSYRGSIDLAPPEEAPAPPAPGGRGMVNPNYASAGAFEGEKRSKRTSGASMNGLKKIFSGGSASHSRAGSVRVVELPEGRMSGGGVNENLDLMTPGGSDVLWFKGMGRDGVWVSGN